MELVRQKLTDIEKGEAANPESVLVDALGHDLGHLPVLVAVDVDTSVDSERGQLLILLTLGDVLVAKDRLVFVKHDPVLGGAPHVVVVGAAVLETLDGGSGHLAHLAHQVGPVLQGFFDVDQSSAHGFIDVFAPEGAVQVNPFVDVIVQQPGGPVSWCIALHPTKQALPDIKIIVRLSNAGIKSSSFMSSYHD